MRLVYKSIALPYELNAHGPSISRTVKARALGSCALALTLISEHNPLFQSHYSGFLAARAR